jgi:pilus assembly protein CpaB
MSKMRVIMLVVAAGAAIGAGVLAKSFIAANRQVASSPSQPNTVIIDEVPKEQVLIVAKDLLMGDKMSEGTIAWQDWPKDQVQPSMITKANRENAVEELKEARARYAMYQGELVIEKKIVVPGDRGFMSAILPKGMRAISVAVSDQTTAGGFILPNDRVDVILTRKLQGGASAGGSTEQIVKSEIALSNVRILAINQTFRQEAEGNTVTVAEGRTATLELTPVQAEVISKIEASGELSLALRSIAESDGMGLGDEKPVLSEAFVVGPNRKVERGITYIRSGISSVTIPTP